MKVLFLSQVVPFPPHGGVLQRGYNLLRELARRDQATLLAFVHPNLLPSRHALEESRRALGEFCEAVEYFPLWPKASPLHGAVALAASAASSQPFSVIAHRSGAFGRRVADLLRSRHFDLIHVDTVALAQFVDAAGPAPVVLTHHNIESMLMERRASVQTGRVQRAYLFRETRKLRAYEGAASRSCDLNILVSRDDEQILTQRVPEARTAVVPNGVDTDYFTPADTGDTPTLVYTGGMGMYANRDAVSYFLGEIWPAIRARVPQVRFFAVGRQPSPEVLAHAARDPQVVATGFIDDIRPIVRESAVYVVPLRVGGGTRLKVLDAMAMGKAIVSTSIGCEGIDVRPGTHVVVADAPAAFADATVALLHDGDRRRALGAAARRLVERQYAWPVVGHMLRRAYDDALSSERKVG